MNDKQLKDFLRDLLSPVLDSLVSSVFVTAKAIYSGFPKDLPEEEKTKILKDIFESQQKVMVHGLNSIVPEDLANKVKEAVNDRK